MGPILCGRAFVRVEDGGTGERDGYLRVVDVAAVLATEEAALEALEPIVAIGRIEIRIRFMTELEICFVRSWMELGPSRQKWHGILNWLFVSLQVVPMLCISPSTAGNNSRSPKIGCQFHPRCIPAGRLIRHVPP
jgi:hypothetical protein